MLLRRAGQLFAEHPEGLRVDLVDLSRSLGVRPDADDLGHHAVLWRTLDRLVRFRTAAWRGEDRLAIHPKLPVLARHRVARLPVTVQAAHHRLLTGHLQGLVARAEGRILEAAGPGRAAPAPAAGRQESEVAPRLRAFGTPAGHDPRIAAR